MYSERRDGQATQGPPALNFKRRLGALLLAGSPVQVRCHVASDERPGLLQGLAVGAYWEKGGGEEGGEDEMYSVRSTTPGVRRPEVQGWSWDKGGALMMNRESCVKGDMELFSILVFLAAGLLGAGGGEGSGFQSRNSESNG